MAFRRYLGAIGPAWRVARGVSNAITERNLDLISAGVAFYAMLAIFPAVAAVIALWGFMSDPDVIADQMTLLSGFVPSEAFALLDRQIDRLVIANDSTLGLATLISTGAALWSTRAGVGALLRGLNAAYGTVPRSGIRAILWTLFITVALVAVSLFSLASVVVAPILLNLLPLGELTQAVIMITRWTLTGAVMLGTLGLVYRYGPHHRGQRPRWLSAGAVLALVLWACASALFTTYLTNFGSYNEVYGSIGAVIALLMWFFISAFSVLLGAAVNAEIDLVHPVERPRRFRRFRRRRADNR